MRVDCPRKCLWIAVFAELPMLESSVLILCLHFREFPTTEKEGLAK